MHDVVVIGGSMGAFDVVKRICASLPEDLPAAILIVLHVAPNSPNLFGAALDRAGALPALTASDDMPISPGRIYVAPADWHMLVVDNRIRLGRGPKENMSRPAIDPLFRSAALNHGPRVIGVVLTGFLNDGASGLSAIKQCGGVTVVQNPDDATAPDMPLGALRAGDIDYRAPADQLAGVISRLVSEAPGPAGGVSQTLQLEVDIALGRPCNAQTMTEMARPVPLSCPGCGGVLSEVKDTSPVRYRCQVGHGYSAEALNHEQLDAADEALRVALRIIDERITLLTRMMEDDRANGRPHSAERMEARLREYQENAEIIRRSLLRVEGGDQ